MLTTLVLAFLAGPAAGQPPYKTGAKPSPPTVIAASPRFLRDGKIGAPVQFVRIPDRIHIWGNNRFGDCVTAEEAFAKIAAHPHVWVSEQEVIDWARRNGVLDGATLAEVLDEMRTRGLLGSDGKRYEDGPAYVVDYRDKATLCAAIYKGPVKVAVASGPLIDSLNRNGGKTGWAGIGYRTNDRTDHCTAYLGYGPADYLYAELAKQYPEARKPDGVRGDEFGLLMFTWGTIGFVNWDSHLAICREAWVREPTTDGFPEPAPQPDPTPVPPPPNPSPEPTPPPNPSPEPTPPPAPDGGVLWYWLAVAALVGLIIGLLGRRLRVTVAAILILGTMTASVSAADPAASCVQVKAVVPLVGHRSGSGTVVAVAGGRSLVLTAGHVVPAGCREVTVTAGNKTMPAAVLARDQWADLAALTVGAVLAPAPLATAAPADGAAVSQYGFTGGGKLRRTPGTVRGLALPLNGLAELATSCPTNYGDSGGGLFNGAGELIGVVVQKFVPGGDPAVPGDGRCVHLADVRRFVRDTARVPFPKLFSELCKVSIFPPACPPGIR